jgi:xylulokinase
MLLLGIDLGTSSIKVSVVDADTQSCIASAQHPETEANIISIQPGWAEQDPNLWWQYVQQAIIKCHATKRYNTYDIGAIGIAYQMHGLVIVDKAQQVLRNSIIWCDSRAVGIGERALQQIGNEKALSHLLNSPGNFTASKLAWVKEYEPAIYDRIHKIMLPGDFIAMKMTGDITTSSSALSEGIFWDFKTNTLSEDVLNHFGFSKSIFPEIQPLFQSHGSLKTNVAAELSVKPGIPISYKAGDQPNNALALNVLQPGEVAATAGTSGVIYGVSDQLAYDKQSRINSFAHVNHTESDNRIGVLLCINGTGIFNRWIKNNLGPANAGYDALNAAAATITPGSNGLFTFPFGNGAERMLNNQVIGAHIDGLDFNIHNTAHLVRAAQEGIAFSFRYGLDIMRENGINPSIVRAAQTNLFLSDVFANVFVNVNNVALEFYEGDGSYGAAIGAGIGSGYYASATDASGNRKPIRTLHPEKNSVNTEYNQLYLEWKAILGNKIDQQKLKNN